MESISINDINANLGSNTFISRFLGDEIVEVSVEYESAFPNAKILREFTDLLAKQFGINPKWRTRLVLIVDELNNNAIEYGSNKQEINKLSIYFKRLDDNKFLINISVTDSGKGAHAKKSDEMEEMRKRHENKDFAEHNSIRGRGLFLIISKLVDTLYFKDSPGGGLQVGFEKLLQLDD